MGNISTDEIIFSFNNAGSELKCFIIFKIFRNVDERLLGEEQLKCVVHLRLLFFSSTHVLITFFRHKIYHTSDTCVFVLNYQNCHSWKLTLINSLYKPLAVRSYREYNERLEEIWSIQKPLIYNLNEHTFFSRFRYFPFSLLSTAYTFVCIVKWDWWKQPGHYSPCRLVNLCALTSTKMSDPGSTHLPWLPPGTINPRAGHISAEPHLPLSGAGKLLFETFFIYFFYFPLYLFLVPVSIHQQRNKVVRKQAGWKWLSNNSSASHSGTAH